ncbi:kinase-like protein [Hypoxylon trugodes]|uniref:kinase-like protein n=1 Tax=Hypoxylon trugodes TaxID=326681 RepID=UPI002199D7F7|nr:kinase-like protein [Hypoxylon trugodes]KAI1391829.1 kinase-like protein [Hypoxylon trugodes]
MKMDSEEEVSRHGLSTGSDAKTDDGDTQSISVSSGARLIPVSESRDVSHNRDEVEEHRNMMLASLLEDYYRTRATEFLNAANPGKNYTRQSPEVQPLARKLFGDASRTLASNGVLSDFSASDTVRGSRRQYLSALDSLVATSQAPNVNILNPMRDLISQTSQLALVPHPANDLQLTLQSSRVQSHYQSSFQELALLGKGGFGRVYQCFNPLDQRTYAVKKIQLSPKLGKRFRDGRLEELQHILREVQALATLDHPNIVRYHATWLEEPRQTPEILGTQDSDSRPGSGHRQQLLLDSHPFSEDDAANRPEPSLSGGVIFAEDTPSIAEEGAKNHEPSGRQWFEEPSSTHGLDRMSSVSNTSDIFTDGKSHSMNLHQVHDRFDATGHTLYIQMSLYPMTLAQYLSLSDGHNTPKHCFHLVPSLQLLRAIHAGLRYIHAKGFIHRDIKPGNIFLSSPEGESQGGYCSLACGSCRRNKADIPPRWLNPRIGDFGLVAQLAQGELPYVDDASSASSGKPVGTAYYRPPSSTGANDEKIDIFALGVVFVEMLCSCGTAMERVDMLKRLQKGCLPLSIEESLENEEHPADVVEEVVSLAKAMVDPNPRARWSSSQVDEAIESILRKL